MKNDKNEKNSITSVVKYHFVFCPRYRRKIFSIDGVEPRFGEVLRQICEQNGIDILTVECGVDFCHVFVNCSPRIAPSEIVRLIKNGTARVLISEFSEFGRTKNLWTRNYYVSTIEKLSPETVRAFVDSQKTRS